MRYAERQLERAQSIADLRLLARRRLPKAVFDFIDGGAADELTLRGNETAFDDWFLVPRVAVDVSNRIQDRRFLSSASAMPIMLSPTGLAGILSPRRRDLGRASRCAQRPAFCLSTNSIASIEEVARAVPDGDRWFQLYFLRDREWMDGLLRRAAEANYRVLCLTVDLPLTGKRERDVRNGFTLPLRPHADISLRYGLPSRMALRHDEIAAEVWKFRDAFIRQFYERGTPRSVAVRSQCKLGRRGPDPRALEGTHGDQGNPPSRGRGKSS